MSHRSIPSYATVTEEEQQRVDLILKELIDLQVETRRSDIGKTKERFVPLLQALKDIFMHISDDEFKLYRKKAVDHGNNIYDQIQAAAKVSAAPAKVSAAPAKPVAPLKVGAEANRKYAALMAMGLSNNETLVMALTSPNFTQNEKNYLSQAKSLRASLETARAADPPNAPPGYRFVETPPLGDCMFHAVYYAWYPARGSDHAQLSGSANTIRQILVNAASEEDMAGLTSALFDSAWTGNKRDPDYQRDLVTLARLDNSQNMRAVQGGPPVLRDPAAAAAALPIRLRIYRKWAQRRQYWGGNLELMILNKYAAANGLPLISVWNETTGAFEVGPQGPGTAPIHWNGINHFSILERVVPGGRRKTRRGRRSFTTRKHKKHSKVE